MKLYISNEGIKEPIDSIYKKTSEDLRDAMRVGFYIPPDFRYSHDLNSLRIDIYKFYNDLNKIRSTVYKIENRYNNTFVSNAYKIKYSIEKKVPERTGVQQVI